MKLISIPVIITTVVAALLCSACGFHIATKHNLGEKYTNLVFIGNKHNMLYIELEKQLILNGVNVVYGNKSPSYYNKIYLPVLTCGGMSNSSTTVAVGSNSQDLEYTMRSQVTCNLYTPNQEPYSIKTSINRATVSTPGCNLASDSKNAVLASENAYELAHEIIDRLHGSYLSLSSKNNDAQNSNTANNSDAPQNPLADEHVRVVFNATSGEEPVDATVVKNEGEAQAVIDSRTSDSKNKAAEDNSVDTENNEVEMQTSGATE